VFWVRANDRTSFDNAFRDIGQQLKIPGLEDDRADVKRLVKTRLLSQDSSRYSIIYNYPEGVQT
jgi:hypothetical protein